MKLSSISDKIIDREIDKFKDTTSGYIVSLMAHFLPEESIKLFEAHLKQANYDSLIESILKKIFHYARGDFELDTIEEREIMKQACDTITSILWKAPASSKMYHINWTDWVKMPLGFAIKACYARLNDTLTCEEVGILLGYTRQEISRRAKLNLIPHKRIGGSYVFYKKDLVKKKFLPEPSSS
ncbi:MAG: hypothetical protein AB1454_10705 [Candidatus Auribacterota bacterium]|jgi:hypothetical protein